MSSDDAANTEIVPITMKDPSLYINRELSQLEFNARVLEQAKDDEVPLLERLRYLTICSANLDEFFEIRVSGLMEFIQRDVPRTDADGLSAEDALKRIYARAHQLISEQYRVLNDVLLPALDEQGFRLHRRAEWDDEQQAWIERYFHTEVLPVLTPIGLDLAHPFPRIVNKSLNFAVTVEGKDAFDRSSGVAIVQVPRSLPRVMALPGKLSRTERDFVMLSSIIHAHIDALFPGMTVTGCYQFRVTRDSDLWVDEEEIEDMMRALKGELLGRRYADAVRLEVADNCPREMADFLLDKFDLGPTDLFFCNGPVNLNRLSALYTLIDRPDMKFPSFAPRVRRPFLSTPDTFEAIAKGDRVLHHPFDSFSPVIELVRQAARDPNVLAIKQTLYRVGADSPIVDALIEAARSSTEVTVLVELRARFDEEENIALATRLQEAGAKVGYGVVGYKTHAKMLLVVRREGNKLRRYVHLGTGNYHHRTTQAYTDIGFLTCDEQFGEDVHNLFNQLTGLGQVRKLKKIIQSPFALAKTMVRLIRAEADEAAAGRPARIVARMNALADTEVIDELYRAARKGVKIDLIVRGVCCLRPGVKDVSDNIRVRSIIGRFLEHSRVFYFHAAGKELLFCASADWMTRNLHRRVETCFPIDDPGLKARIYEETLELYLKDDTQAWELRKDGSYRRASKGDGDPISAQRTLLEKASKAGTGKKKRKLPRHLVPHAPPIETRREGAATPPKPGPTVVNPDAPAPTKS